ncbi:hypothetical protein CCAX7_29980 [Capsulimonas corticalis]|uniref:Uncharacterized protein n=1 Tax=Capsulimonas corticalis TaxID=2219043 RepID=A0A402CSU4_9BACT|nr:hypothetical protein [Capsulimonas corticalis]BDI30947.1 hypothetical protein CCAX7_29980 [Capsulimonas corticalis]
MDFREKLRKVASLVVELPPESVTHSPASGHDPSDPYAAIDAQLSGTAPPPLPSRTVEQLVAQSEGPSLEAVQEAASAIPTSPGEPELLSFPEIYRQAGVPAAPFTAEQMLDMLSSMPASLPLDIRRQTIGVTLSAMGKAIGATPDTIVADASRKLAALASYADTVAAHTAAFTASADQEIAELQLEIDRKKRAIETARQNQIEVAQLCHNETDRLDDVLEFFSLDIGASKHAG